MKTSVDTNFNFNSYEYHPCQVVGRDEQGHEIVEQVDDNEEQADFWSVYGHLREGGLEWLCDCQNRVVAELITIGLLATLNVGCPECGAFDNYIDASDGYFRICNACGTNFQIDLGKGMRGYINRSFR